MRKDFCESIQDSIDRLKVMVVEFGGESDSKLSVAISNEISNTAQHLNGKQRKDFLVAIRDNFPLLTDFYNSEYEQVRQDKNLTYDDKDPLFLCSKLVEVYEKSSVDVRNLIEDFLENNGVLTKTQKNQHSISKYHNSDIFPETYLLADFVRSIELFVSRMWESISPESRIDGLGRLAKKLESEYPEHTQTDSERALELENLKHIIIAVITALNSASISTVVSVMHNLSPRRIEGDAKMEGSGIWTSVDVKCWKKYKERFAQQINIDWVERQVRQRVVSEVLTFLSKVK